MDLLEISLWALLLLLLLVCYYRYSVRNFHIWSQLGITGPTPLPLFGTILPTLLKGVAKYDQELIRKYGKIIGTFEGRFPVLVVAEEEALKYILVKNFSNFTDRRCSDIEPFPINKTLAKLRGSRWKNVRCLLNPLFSTAKLKAMSSAISRCSLTMTENLMEMSRNKTAVDIKDCCGAFALDVIAEILLGIGLESQQNPNDPFVHHTKRILRRRPIGTMVFVLFALPFLMPVLKAFNVRPNLLPKDSLQYLVDSIDCAIQLREKDPQTDRADFLQQFLNFRNSASLDQPSETSEETSHESPKPNGLSHDEILAQAFMFLIAGYETTATAAAMLAYNLSRHPACQRKLQDEIDEHYHSGEICCEDVAKMTYLQMCIDESLRLYPPVLRVDRYCSKSTTIGSLVIPAGCLVTIPIYAVNNDPEYWSEPDQFRPERFSSSEKFFRSPSTYLSFGLGPRGCIGRRLALLELKILFAHILHRFTIKPSQKSQRVVEFEKGVLLQLKKPLFLEFEIRNNQ